MSLHPRTRVDRKTFGYQRPTRSQIRSGQIANDTQKQLAATMPDLKTAVEVGLPSFITGQTSTATQRPDASGVLPSVKRPRGRPRKVPLSPDAEIVRGLGAALDHSLVDNHSSHVEGSNIPETTAVLRGEIGQRVVVPHDSNADLATHIRVLREKYYDLRTLTAQRVGTINRVRAHCRHVVAESDPEMNVFYLTKEEEEASKKARAAKKKAMAVADELYAALKEDTHHPLLGKAIGTADPLIGAIRLIEKGEEAIEKQILAAAKSLPVAKWALEQKGLSLLAVGKIVGAAGDLNRFETENGGAAVAKFWKFMEVGLTQDPFDGTFSRQQRRSNADLAKAHAYSGLKRSLMWNIGNSLIGGMGKGKRPRPGEDIDAIEGLSYYEKLFMVRLRHHATTGPELHAKDNVVNAKGEERESYSKHAANMAKRYVEKRMLKLLYLEWRRTTGRSYTADTEMPA